MESVDVIVVGGGVVGCAVAAELAPDHEVLVIEKASVASGATGKASGLLSPIYDHQANPEAAAYATEFFDSFDGTHNADVSRRDGLFLFAEREREHAAEAVAVANDAGFDADLLDPEAVRERYPGVFNMENYAGAARFDGVGWIDSHTFATALQKRAEAEGATLKTGTKVNGVMVEDGVTGVRTDHGDFEAPAVVVAAGWATRQFLADLVTVPLRPFRYQTAELEVEGSLDEPFPIAWEHENLLYWRPTRTGDLHVGGQPYFVGSPGTTKHGATADFKRTIAKTIPHQLPSLGDPRLQSDDTCLTGDAATPDGLPIFDAPEDAPDGLVVATGMHGLGIMLAPVAGATVRSLVTGEEPPFPTDLYRLDRFEDRGTDFGSDYIADPP